MFPIEIPPLRERREDIRPLAEHFVRLAVKRLGLSNPRLSNAQISELENYDWPGNVRELQNVIERAVILARGGRLQFELGKPSTKPAANVITPPTGLAHEAIPSLDELKRREKEVILNALTRGLLENLWDRWGCNAAWI